MLKIGIRPSKYRHLADKIVFLNHIFVVLVAFMIFSNFFSTFHIFSEYSPPFIQRFNFSKKCQVPHRDLSAVLAPTFVVLLVSLHLGYTIGVLTLVFQSLIIVISFKHHFRVYLQFWFQFFVDFLASWNYHSFRRGSIFIKIEEGRGFS